jgi:SAM-dependent methyltransferase
MSDKTCPICLKPMHPYPVGEKNGYALESCRHCGSVITTPWVTPDMREKFLAEVEPQITHVSNPLGEVEDLRKIIKRICAGNTNKKFLDISCRNGYSVQAAKSQGLQAKGIDEHEFYIEFAQKNYDQSLFECMSVSAYADKGTQADIVFARDSFCEQSNPDAYAASIARIIAPGGILYIEEPDGNSFNTPRNFNNWPVAYPPMNFAFYSKKGMIALLERHGLRVQKIFFNWRPVMRMIIAKS